MDAQRNPKFAELIEHESPLAVAFFDREMRYISTNAKWREDYQLGDQPLIGRSHYDVFPEIPEFWKDVHTRAQAGETLSAKDERFDRLDGHVALQRAAQLKDEFLASMSHELRTPISAVLTISEALRGEVYGALSSPQSEALEMIHDSGSHLLELINEILDLSKIEAGELHLQLTRCVAADLARSCLVLVRRLATARKHKLGFAENTLDAITFAGDPKRIKQILVNLLSNAIKFTPEGGSLGLIVDADEATRQIHFTVWDSGIGIQRENHERIFRPFTQIDSTLAREFEGTGLGLSLARKFAQMHDGDITLESTPGEGSRFTVTLPWRPPPPAEPVSPPVHVELESAPSSPSDGADAETNASAQRVVRILERLRVESTVMTRIEGALKRVVALQPDAIILDVVLPDGSGWSAMRMLKAHPRTRDIPVVVVSGFRGVCERASVLGAAECFLEPFSDDDLAQVVERLSPSRVVVIALEQSHRVLIADDNRINLKTYADILTIKGYQVDLATNGAEAIESALAVKPDCILMDIQMPGVDGFEAIETLRERGFTRPIVALTALVMPGDRERCLQAGADAYLAKPVAVDAVLECVKTLIANSEALAHTS